MFNKYCYTKLNISKYVDIVKKKSMTMTRAIQKSILICNTINNNF